MNKVLLPKYSTKHIKVYVIPQTEIIKHIGIQFVGGRHFLVEPKIPDGECWIAKELMATNEGLYFIYHELHEMNLMSLGMDYDSAHSASNRVEGRARNEHIEDVEHLIELEKKKYENRIIERSHLNGTMGLHADTKLHHKSHHDSHSRMKRKTTHQPSGLVTMRS